MKNCKLTDSQVLDVKRQLDDGIPMSFLSAIYGISISLIKKIKHGYRQ